MGFKSKIFFEIFRWLFRNLHQNERFQIKMNDCSKSPMIVETYKVEGKNKRGALIHSTKAFVNGNGYIDYAVSLLFIASRQPKLWTLHCNSFEFSTTCGF